MIPVFHKIYVHVHYFVIYTFLPLKLMFASDVTHLYRKRSTEFKRQQIIFCHKISQTEQVAEVENQLTSQFHLLSFFFQHV